MATTVLTDAYVSIGGNVISDHVTQVSLSYSAEALEETAMGDTNRIKKAGLKDWSLTVELLQDFAASQIDSIFFPLIGTNVAFEIRPTSAAVSTSNPKFTGTAVLVSYPILGNSVGDLATATLELAPASALTRATA